MAEGTHNVRVVQVLGEGHFHGGPIWGALNILVLLRRYDLHPCTISSTRHQSQDWMNVKDILMNITVWSHSCITKRHQSQVLTNSKFCSHITTVSNFRLNSAEICRHGIITIISQTCRECKRYAESYMPSHISQLDLPKCRCTRQLSTSNSEILVISSS